MRVLLLLFIFLTTPYLYSDEIPEWEYLNGPYGGKIFDIEVDTHNAQYLASYRGIYKRSTEHKWEKVINCEFVWDISIEGNLLVASTFKMHTNEKVILISKNNGMEWDSIAPFWEDQNPFQIKIAENKIYLLLSGDGISDLYFSTDTCKTWVHTETEIYSEGEYKLRYLFIYNDKIIVSGWDYTDYSTGVMFITNDDGKTWHKEEYDFSAVTSYLEIDNNEYWIGSNNGLFKSHDKGENWSQDQKIGSSFIYAILQSNNKEIFLLTEDGVYYSSNSGNTWENRSNGLPPLFQSSFCQDRQGNIYVGNFNAVYFSSNKGASWESINEGFSASNVRDLAFDNSGNIYAATVGVDKSTDNGNTWKFAGLHGIGLYNIICDNDGVVMVSGSRDQGIFRSTDEGETWEECTEGLQIPNSDYYVSVSDFAMDNNGVVFISASPLVVMKDGSRRGGIMYTTDHGKSWIGTNFISGANFIAINSVNHLFSGYIKNALYRSTDYGDTWENVQEYNSSYFVDIDEMVFIPGTTIGLTNGGNSACKSTDNGKTWYDHNYIGPASEELAVDSLYRVWDASDLSSSGRLRFSVDSAQSWIRVDSVLNHHNFISVTVSPQGYIFAGAADGGLYRSKEAYLGVNENNNYPSNYLLQNIPNPASETTRIEYTIPINSYVKLKIVNVLGETVSIPVNEYQDSGEHTVSVSCSDIQPGIYYYILEYGAHRESRQMIVVR